MTIDRRLRPLFAVGYLLGLMLVLVPLIELLANAFPLTVSAPRWRYGFVGYAGNNALLPTVGFGIAVLTAAVLDHRRALQTLAIVGAAAGIFLVPTLALFGLDALQVRAGANPALIKSFDIATFKAGSALFLSLIVCLWVAIAAWRLARHGDNARTRRKQAPDRTLIRAGGSAE